MREIGESIKEERIKFKPGLQKKFLEIIKEKSKMTWAQLAKKLNLSTHTISFDWRNEKSTMPVSLVKKLLEDYNFEKWEKIEKEWVEKILDKNWGQILSGEKNKKAIKIPEKDKELAELLGVILGDGHLERKTLIITGNAYEKAHYLYLSGKIHKLFGLNSRITKLKNENTMQLKVHSVELIRFLLNNNMKIGNKIIKKSSLAKWVFKRKEFVYAALRGLFDTDGGIYNKQKKYKRAIIELQTKSPYIWIDINQLLKMGGFTSSKSATISGFKPTIPTNNIRIQNQDEIHKFFRLVGSSNPKNIVRYKHFIKNGYIPLKEDLKTEIINFKGEVPYFAALV